MAAGQAGFEYAVYDYPYNSTATSEYPAYTGYEQGSSYATTGGYDEYAASGAYHSAAAGGQAYATVDPYSGYTTTTYAYPTAGAPAGPPSTTGAQTSYSSSAGGYPYESRRTPPPALPTTASASATHYPGYEYATGTTGTYSMPTQSSAAYPTYKAAAPNGTTSAVYSNYPAGAASAHAPYGVPPVSHMPRGGAIGPPSVPSLYGTSPSTAAGVPSRRPDYYSTPSVPSPMHYAPHQPQPMPYRLPPRGGYQRELDEPGDENALLRHVVYVTGLPKEIQNETLAEVFGASCGQIAPVDVRSPKPKIWVYKDRQTREGKGEATITFINPESAQMAISYFNGKELFGREIRVTLCPRRMYNMQKQNTPFNPGAAPVSTTTPISAMIKTTTSNGSGTTISNPSTTNNTIVSTTTTTPATSASASGNSSTPTTTTTTAVTTSTSSSNTVTAANPIATISSSTLGLPRQLNHSLFKIRQTPEQQRGLLPTPPINFGGPMMSGGLQRDGVRKELPRIALTRGNYANPAGVRPKPY